jgi:antitoxin component YwqK of YwqJK toxin-antitoxin module
MDRNDKILSIATTGLLLGGMIMLYRMFSTSKDVKDAQIQAEKSSQNRVLQPEYNYVTDKNKQVVMSGAQLDKVATAIYGNMHGIYVGIKDTALYNAALMVKNARQLGQLKSYYMTKYKKDLILDLSETLVDSTINRWSSNGVHNKIMTYWNGLK